MGKAETPMVSIVVAAYNAAVFIKENIESLLNQTYADFELIYVNDGSKDNTVEILQGYQKKDERVIILSQENQGAGAARNLGLRHAAGKYLLVLDADDYFDIRMLETIVPLAEERRTDILIFDSWDLNHQTGLCTPGLGSILADLVPEMDVFPAADIANEIFIITGQYVWNKLYLREFVTKNKIEFQPIRIADDMYFEMLSIVYAERISVCKERLVYYRKNHLINQMANTSQLVHCYYEGCKGVFDEFKKRGLYELWEKSLIEKALDGFFFAWYCNREFKDFQQAFHGIKKRYFPSLGFYEIKEEQFRFKQSYEFVQKIKNMELEEFLFNGHWVINHFKEGYYPAEEMIAHVGKIVLYGAGAVGKNYYSHLLAMPRNHVIAWVDKNYSDYQKWGLYVQPPEVLQNLEYDYVYIAIKDEHIKDNIVHSLQDLGVNEDKIVWYQPKLV